MPSLVFIASSFRATEENLLFETGQSGLPYFSALQVPLRIFSFIGRDILSKTKTKQKRIRITCPCNEHPLTPHFYIEKVGFSRVYIVFLFLLQTIDCGYSLEPPR